MSHGQGGYNYHTHGQQVSQQDYYDDQRNRQQYYSHDQQQFYGYDQHGYDPSTQQYYPHHYPHQQQEYQYDGQYHSSPSQSGYDGNDDNMMEEIENEMALLTSQTQHQSPVPKFSDDIKFLCEGAMPSVNGKLTKAAAEFWFPKYRECACCMGYIHGCKCCVNGVTQCSCSTPLSFKKAGTSGNINVIPPNTSSFEPSNKSSTHYVPPTNSANLPSGAVPTMGGRLTKSAAEFWFPESRNCECCLGYKHGCKCCVQGVSVCFCGNQPFTQRLPTTQQSSHSQPPSAPSSMEIKYI